MERWTITKVSNRGSRHPVVARLIPQMGDLIEWSDLPKDKRDAVLNACSSDLYMRLGRCWDIWEELGQKQQECISEYVPSQERIVDFPHISYLDREVENFLYEAKNFLRDLLNKVVKVFYPDIELSDAKSFFDSKGQGHGALTSWASEKFGDDDKLTLMLRAHQPWIEELVRKRNAVEHPEGYSGRLEIQNFARTVDGTLLLPLWRRTGHDTTYIVEDIGNYCHWLLTFAEEMIIFGCIERNTHFPNITFYEIPDEERSKDNPIRFRAGFTEEFERKIGRRK